MKLSSRPVAHPASDAARALAKDERGGALVEFAIVVIPLMALLIAIVQTSLTFFAQQTLETTAEKSVRSLITGSAQLSGTTQAQFKTLACGKLPAFMTCANLLIDVRAASAFSDATTAPPTLTFDGNGNVTNSFAYTPGAAGSINIVKMMYIWDTQKGPLGFDLSTMSSGKRLLIVTSVFKTEPYK